MTPADQAASLRWTIRSLVIVISVAASAGRRGQGGSRRSRRSPSNPGDTARPTRDLRRLSGAQKRRRLDALLAQGSTPRTRTGRSVQAGTAAAERRNRAISTFITTPVATAGPTRYRSERTCSVITIVERYELGSRPGEGWVTKEAVMPSSTAVLVRYGDPDDVSERMAVAGFLAGYTGATRVSYATDLRLIAEWCAKNGVRLLDVKRAHLELFARHLEAEGRMRSTIARRLSTLASFYRYCHVEGVVRRNPAADVRRPKVITSPTRWGWIATSSAPCSCRPGSARHGITRWSPC
jgi:hypothetical protein